MSKPPIDPVPAPAAAPAAVPADDAPKNGTDNSGGKVDSTLTKIHKQWVASGSKMPTAEEGKKLVANYTASMTKVFETEAALAAAKANEYAAVEKLAQAYGTDRSIRIGGVVHDFASRGTIVFFRKKTTNDVVDL